MHNLGARILAVCAVIILGALAVLVAVSGIGIKEPVTTIEEPETESSYSLGKETLHLWYTDDKLTDYLNYVAVYYNSEREDVRVVPVLVPGQEYLESISDASMTDEELPDLYITTNDTLEKAHLSGLAEPVVCPDHTDMRSVFMQTAINAVSYHSEYIAYPLFMECSALCCNDTYIMDWARTSLEGEIRANLTDEQKATIASDVYDPESDEEAWSKMSADDKKAAREKSDEEKAKVVNEYVVAQVTDEDVDAYATKAMPLTYDKLLEFADNFDAPEGVETIFKWAVNDIFYNYFFIGDAISIGGQYGDDIYEIDIYNENAIKGLMAYQDLNRFFSINTNDVSYEGVINEFKDKKTVITITTTDAVSFLKEAKKNGEIDFDYMFLPLPDMREGVQARSMSVTDVVAVNGYSPNKEFANDFALYLCTRDAKELYERTGKVSVLKEADFGEDDADISVFRDEYLNSVPLPKMIETSNYWVKLEMLFASVWDGADANKGLKELSEQMMLQITGEEFVEKTIEIEEEEAVTDAAS